MTDKMPGVVYAENSEPRFISIPPGEPGMIMISEEDEEEKWIRLTDFEIAQHLDASKDTRKYPR